MRVARMAWQRSEGVILVWTVWERSEGVLVRAYFHSRTAFASYLFILPTNLTIFFAPLIFSQDIARMLGWFYDRYRDQAPSNNHLDKVIDSVSILSLGYFPITLVLTHCGHTIHTCSSLSFTPCPFHTQIRPIIKTHCLDQ